MEQNNADLSSDTSLGLVCYQEGDLNFDNLNPDECDEERTESIDFSWLPVLKEAGDPEQMEGCVEVCNSASEKEWEWDIPQDIQNQCSGQIQYVGPLDDNVIHETGNKEDEDEKQELSNEERAEKVVQETINKDSDSAEDDEDVVQGTCNKERASSEEDENIGMDDFSFPSYLSQVDSLQGQHLEEKEEATYYEGRQILLKDEEDTIDDNNTMKEMLYHLLPPHSRMQMEGRTNKMESKKGKIVEEKEAKADGNSGNRQLANVLTLLEKDDFHGQSSGDLKEFSEDDQGVTGEDYAEYPSECFQQGDVEDRNKKTGHIKAEKTRKLDGSGHPGGETCEWELLERHRDFCKEQMLRKEGGRDILKESDEIVWGEITEEQASEEELLKGAFNYDNTISQHIHEVGQLVDEITANLYSEHEAHSSVETQEHEFQDDDEEAQVRNWEEENKRIEAFNRYYNDDQGAGAADYAALKNPERKHTVRFCIQPNLPTERQVGDLPGHQSLTTTAQEMKEVPKTLKQRDKSEDSDGKRHKEDFALLLQQSQATQKELLKLNTELKAHCRKDKRPSVLHDCLKISLMTVVGVLFFWWATDQLEWMRSPSGGRAEREARAASRESLPSSSFRICSLEREKEGESERERERERAEVPLQRRSTLLVLGPRVSRRDTRHIGHRTERATKADGEEERHGAPGGPLVHIHSSVRE
ncbi:hypothetical protein GN956_G5245 [Arapaima gigas]